MGEYLHGAFGERGIESAKSAVEAQSAIIYFGTAPVHTVEGGAQNVNRPIVVRNIAEARRYFGYSDDWASYTLCEAMHVHLQMGGVGPLVMINVLDPAVHKAAEGGTLTAKPASGRVNILSAGDVILDSVKVSGKEKGQDFALSYDSSREIVTISELKVGALGTEELSISWDRIDASAVDSADLIGTTDGMGLNTGIYVIRNVYQLTGYVPSTILAPGWSSEAEVHEVMYAESQRVNKHWRVWMRTDLPIIHEGTPLTLMTAATWKEANGYNKDNEAVYFPMAKGTDGRIYHISTLAAGNHQKLMSAQDGIPYTTASNTDCPIIERLYLGEDAEGRVYDAALINEYLNQHGINSAAFEGGRWAIWGAHCADYKYDPDSEDNEAAFETNRMMLFFVLNRFQVEEAKSIDKPLTPNDLRSKQAHWQAWLDKLVSSRMLAYGKCTFDATRISRSDVIHGDYRYGFAVSAIPLAKSLTASIVHSNEGYEIYIEEMQGA